jgi:hypothetical protein
MTEKDRFMVGDRTPGTPMPHARDGEDIESFSALFELPPGRWRSLGRHLDYTDWADRDRFKALDYALRSSRANLPK